MHCFVTGWAQSSFQQRLHAVLSSGYHWVEPVQYDILIHTCLHISSICTYLSFAMTRPSALPTLPLRRLNDDTRLAGYRQQRSIEQIQYMTLNETATNCNNTNRERMPLHVHCSLFGWTKSPTCTWSRMTVLQTSQSHAGTTIPVWYTDNYIEKMGQGTPL